MIFFKQEFWHYAKQNTHDKIIKSMQTKQRGEKIVCFIVSIIVVSCCVRKYMYSRGVLKQMKLLHILLQELSFTILQNIVTQEEEAGEHIYNLLRWER